ncbi:N-glycosyltransferase [Falsiruegeria litorea R37]|uniref:N-glycosyltransferase n=1 Tax=Falsiruegeria litorea R37 TaxID=1200284 RepID=A0A1Y5TMJ2_9RHOB|nr:glycosyltransferase [Falsiruegeria litorea]SLN67523.1 N-glycosyltransferase [Falsiruegeria litorea R37]
MSKATILIPAHDEAEVIGRTLWFLSRGLRLDDFQVIVIANGCSDATAARARAALPQARIIETEQAGKCHALNLGYAAANTQAPIVCMDADLDVTAESVTALVAAVSDQDAMAACGKMKVDTAHASALVRAFYQGWRSNPYFDRGKFGGLFAVSASGAARVFPLPDVTADDEYVRRSFGEGQVATVPGCTFVARSPATLGALVNIRRRSLRGAREVAKLGLPSPERIRRFRMLGRALSSPREALPIAVFLAVVTWVRLALVFEVADETRWERDLTSRAVR